MVPRGGIELRSYLVEFALLNYQQFTEVPKFIPTNIAEVRDGVRNLESISIDNRADGCRQALATIG